MLSFFSVEQQEVETQQFYETFAGKLEQEQQKGQQLLIEYQQVRKELKKERLKSAELQQQVETVVCRQTTIVSKPKSYKDWFMSVDTF